MFNKQEIQAINKVRFLQVMFLSELVEDQTLLVSTKHRRVLLKQKPSSSL